MSYRLLKPYTEDQKETFIITYNRTKGLRLEETELALYALEIYEIMVNGFPMVDPNWEKEQTKKRKEAFLKDFFKVEGYGYYRIQPKGYQSVVESMNVLFNVASAMNGVGAGLIIFYTEPDFKDPEQCTEEWLVQHQIVMPAMTKEEFMQLWQVFTQSWNTQEHEIQEEGE